MMISKDIVVNSIKINIVTISTKTYTMVFKCLLLMLQFLVINDYI